MNDSDMHPLATDHGVCYTFKNSGVDGFVTSPGNGPCHSVYYRDLPNISSYLSVPWLVYHPYTIPLYRYKYIYCMYHLNCMDYTRWIIKRIHCRCSAYFFLIQSLRSKALSLYNCNKTILMVFENLQGQPIIVT